MEGVFTPARVVIGGTVLVLLAAALAGPRETGGSSRPSAGQRTTSSAPGSPAVYAEIASATDCKALQATFTRNMDDFDRRKSSDPLRSVVLSYANAAHDRMRATGCYD